MVAFVPVLAPGCTPDALPPPAPKPPVRVRSFTEAHAVRDLVTVPPYAFAATSEGLDRWDLRSGNRVHLGVEHGLPGNTIIDIHHDPSHRLLWIVTATGLARYDLQLGRVEDVPAPPPELAISSLEGASLAADDQGLWIGLESGLYRVAVGGEWSPTEVRVPVRALFRSARGDLWIGTDVGLFTISAHLPAQLGRDRGCDVARVRFIADGPDGVPVIVGENEQGNQRIALGTADGCQSFRVSPAEPWLAAARRGNQLMVLTSRRLYAMGLPPQARRQLRLDRDGMRLYRVLPVDGIELASSPYTFDIVERSLPAGAKTIAAIGDEVLVGTENLGTARLEMDQHRGATQWLRRFELVDDATSLSIACTGPDDCYVATGGIRMWRWIEGRFDDVGDAERPVLAVATAPTGEPYAVRRAPGGTAVTVARIDGETFTDVRGLSIEVGGEPVLSFARFSPGGVLWLGLGRRDDAGELVARGVVRVDVGKGTVAELPAGDGDVLPREVADVAFRDGEAWLATANGAYRHAGSDTERLDRDAADPLRGIAIAADGKTYVASVAGVSLYDPIARRFIQPPQLREVANDLAVTRDGRLWIATDRGLAVFDGARVRRLDQRRGLIEDEIEEIAVDRYDRIWIRGEQGIALITP